MLKRTNKGFKKSALSQGVGNKLVVVGELRPKFFFFSPPPKGFLQISGLSVPRAFALILNIKVSFFFGPGGGGTNFPRTKKGKKFALGEIQYQKKKIFLG